MHHFFACFLLLTLPLAAIGQEPEPSPTPTPPAAELKIDGDYVLTVRTLPITVFLPEPVDFVFWKYPPGVRAVETPEYLLIQELPPGESQITAVLLKIDYEAKKTSQSILAVNLGYRSPTPPEPEPGPDPGPDPKPDEKPPFPSDGFRVLILEETEDRASLPLSQSTILFSPIIRDYLINNTARDAKGYPGYRIWDDDFTNLQYEQQVWKDAYEAAKRDSQGTLPWIVISDGKRGTSQPLPANVDETLALLRQFKQ